MILASTLWLAACLEPLTEQCSWGLICPEGMLCDEENKTCSFTVCGNGVTEGNEACDQGADNSASTPNACRPDCTLPRCGDDVEDDGEACDDGNTLGGDGCSRDCSSNEQCGNGIQDLAQGEACDDGNLRSNDGCSSTCQPEVPTWEQITGGFRSRREHEMVWAGDRLVLFGGFTDEPGEPPTPMNDTWENKGDGWYQVFPTTPPPPQLDGAMAYDSTRGVVMLVTGGNWRIGETPSSGEPVESHTWEYADGEWTERFEAETPPVVPPWTPLASGLNWTDAGALVFHEGDQQMLLLRSIDAEGLDVWRYDGTRWTGPMDLDNTEKPPARLNPLAAFDPTRGSIILHGGQDIDLSKISVPLTDSWSLGPAGWTQLPVAAAALGTLRAEALFFSLEHDRLVLAGGGSGLQMFTLEADAWASLNATSNMPTDGAAIAYRPTSDGIVLTGGLSPLQPRPSSDTWEFAGGSWTQGPDVASASGKGRTLLGMTFDSRRGVVVALTQGGGITVGPPPEPGRRVPGLPLRLWEHDGRQWRAVETEVEGEFKGVAAALSWNGLTEDITIVIDTGTDIQTWAYDGKALIQVQVPGPDWTADETGTTVRTMTWDGAKERVLLVISRLSLFFGIPFTTETWAFDGQWSRIAGGPSTAGVANQARALDFALVYDRDRQMPLLVHAQAEEPLEVYELGETGWVDVGALGGPGNQVGLGVAWNGQTGRVSLFGGGQLALPFWAQTSHDIYERDSSGLWAMTEVVGLKPPDTPYTKMVFDVDRGWLLLHGGERNATETWTFAYRGGYTAEDCSTEGDEDGDQLSDCDDPDCNFAWLCRDVGENCMDGVDNDGDGAVDCADPNCGGQSCGPQGRQCVADACLCPPAEEGAPACE